MEKLEKHCISADISHVRSAMFNISRHVIRKNQVQLFGKKKTKNNNHKQNTMLVIWLYHSILSRSSLHVPFP